MSTTPSVLFDDVAEALRSRLLADATHIAQENIEARVDSFIDSEVGFLPLNVRQDLAKRIRQRIIGLGPLNALLKDDAISEIMVRGTTPVWIERHGKIEQTQVRFESEQALRHTIERILAPLGRRVDEAQPLVDARLSDGSRVHVVIPPLALDGPSLTIRRFRSQGFSPDELVTQGTLPQNLMNFLEMAVSARANILICGGTGSGKTTTLNTLSSFIGEAERIVTIEDAAELALQQQHVVRLEARLANVEGSGEVTIRELVRNSLRMRPDRIIVGEVRGAEALDLLVALSSGHDGALSTVHAGSGGEALRRIETLALMADLDLPHRAIREQVADAFDLIVCQMRASDGARRIVEVCEVGCDEGVAVARELYRWQSNGEYVIREPRENSRLASVAFEEYAECV